MVDFTKKEGKYVLTVDKRIFNERVISKAIYWLSLEYFIYWQEIENYRQVISFEKKDEISDKGNFNILKEKINQLLIDYKTRDIVNQETKNIRDLLYVKAFANNDDYEDFNLLP